jgi:hypothetical protein
MRLIQRQWTLLVWPVGSYSINELVLAALAKQNVAAASETSCSKDACVCRNVRIQSRIHAYKRQKEAPLVESRLKLDSLSAKQILETDALRIL